MKREKHYSASGTVKCPHCGREIPISFIINLPATAVPKCPWCGEPLYEVDKDPHLNIRDFSER